MIFFRFSIHRGQLESSVAEEKRYNPRLTKDIDTFIQIMENLNLPKPKMIGKWPLVKTTNILSIIFYFIHFLSLFLCAILCSICYAYFVKRNRPKNYSVGGLAFQVL